MRVLISAESFVPSVNGVAGSVLQIADELTSAGHVVRIIAPAPGPSEVWFGGPVEGRRVSVDRVKGCTVPTYPTLSFGLLTARSTRAIIESFEPDVVHLAAPVTLGHAVARAAAQLDVPTVAVFQTDLAGFLASRGARAAAAPVWSWLKLVHSSATLNLAPTEGIAQELRARGFHRVGVWGRGVDRQTFDPSRRSDTFRRSVGCGPGDVLMGYVGRLAPEKEIWRLATVASEAKRPGSRVKLVVVGDGPSRSELQTILGGAVFTGMLSGPELGEAMASLDLFVHTGSHDTFGQTIQEAMASRVAVVAPDAGGPADLVDHGRTGLLYDPTSASQLNDAVSWLVDSPTKRAQLAEAGFEAVRERSWGVRTRQLVGWYEQAGVLSAAAPPSGQRPPRMRRAA
ncbi:MAG: glycosyltransferase family 1 protein [Acidimicrobiales bacterium]|nr:glycosyltransferase family 1 protein [Acidimicrobiales bacterium]